MFASFFHTRPKPKHTHLSQRDAESLDSGTLLPPLSSIVSQSSKINALDRSSRDIKLAVKALVLSTSMYLGAGLWLASSI
jgi:hypothetical protein